MVVFKFFPEEIYYYVPGDSIQLELLILRQQMQKNNDLCNV